MASALRLDALPVDLFAGVASCLLGIDLLSLSHVNHVLLTELLPPDGDVWTQRASDRCPRLDATSAKQRYFQTHSFQFPGLTRDKRDDRGGAVLFPFTLTSVIGRSSFSFGVWFALAPGGRRKHTGGVIVGAQSGPIHSHMAVNRHMQVIHVDAEGYLYCSATTTKIAVAKKLELNRWYHLVLTFDKPTPWSTEGVETVYLDCKPVHTSVGHLYQHRTSTPFWQIGSGFISEGPGEPTPDHCGWYGFNGMIDDFRIWKRVLSPVEIQELKNDQEISEIGHLWSLRGAYRNGAPLLSPVQPVACSRPQERLCVKLAAHALRQ